MKIINKYLVVDKFVSEPFEVVELQNGNFYKIEYSSIGIPSYIKMDREKFFDLLTHSKLIL